MKRIFIVLLPVMLMALPASAFACKCVPLSAETSKQTIDNSAFIVKGLVERVFVTRKGAELNKASTMEAGAEIDVEEIYKGDDPGDTFKMSYLSDSDCSVSMEPGTEGEFIVMKKGDAYEFAGQCAKLTDDDWKALREGKMKPKIETPAPIVAEDGSCDESVFAFVTGAYEVLGHTPAGDDKDHLYSGALELSADHCKLIAKRCDTTGANDQAELTKVLVTADNLTAWKLDIGERHYTFEAEATNGNNAVFHGQYSEGDSTTSNGREFWYPRQEDTKPVCEIK